MDSDTCIQCHAEFTELGLLPDERFVSCDGALTCSLDCCHEHNLDVMDARECAVLFFSEWKGLSP